MNSDPGKVTFVLGGYREVIPPGIEQSTTMAGGLWKELRGGEVSAMKFVIRIADTPT
jgi:hypothetical protein